MYFTRPAHSTDCLQFIDIAVRFFNETTQNGKLTVRPDKFERFFQDALLAPQEIAIILAISEKDWSIAGYSIPVVQAVYTDENIGDLYQFYVAPEHRASGCARALVAATVAQFTQWDCVISHTYAAPGLRGSEKNVALFRNLWQKYDFEQSGVIMTKGG